MRTSRSLALRRQHLAQITQDPADLVIHAKRKVASGSGGYVNTSSDLAPQRARLVQSRAMGRSDIRTPEGRVVAEDWLLMGLPEMEVEVNDTFDYAGDKWEVRSEVERSSERTLMGVVNRGPADAGY
jgi:hypothetical protein